MAPSAIETVPLFAITWNPDATPGYAVGNFFLVSTSFCEDESYNGCVSNADVQLPFAASVYISGTEAPEPGYTALLGLSLLGMRWL